MATYSETTAAALNELIKTCKDGEEGFRTAAEDVKDASLKSLFNELSTQRAGFAAELQQLVRGLGEGPENSGSVSAAIHRGWIDLKAAVTSQDRHGILAECERGEDSAVAAYRDALASPDLAESIKIVIQRQYAAVQAAHDRVRDLRDAAKS